MPTIAISIVIGTFNQRETLNQTLLSLFDQTVSEDIYEIIVVDSESSDGTEAMIRSLNPPCDLEYIRQPNLGKAAARNRGIRAASGSIIIITDADMLADEKLIEEHLLVQSKYKNLAAEGLTYNLKSFGPDFKNPKNIDPYIKEKLKPLQKIRWSYFLTGNLSAKKQTLLDAGLFDENFTGYGWEDIELGYRLKQMKVPLVYLPAAQNYHWHPVTKEENLERKLNTGKSAAYFYQKHTNFEIKMFLGMNPLAMFIFKLIDRSRLLKSLLIKNSQAGWLKRLCRYLLEEYTYRLGLMEELKNKKAAK
ncbi:MAG: glycosyltransferase [Candidatus Margulisiibacteriota bacterium]